MAEADIPQEPVARGAADTAGDAGGEGGGDATEDPASDPDIMSRGSDSSRDRFAGFVAERPAPHALARGVAAQIADAARAGPGAPVEIILSPQELGTLRMTLCANETSVSITLLADRPETLELMRRHADLLEREFRDAGYAEVAFTFAQSGGEDRPRGGSAILAGMADDTAAPPTTLIAVYRPAAGPATGLDMRL